MPLPPLGPPPPPYPPWVCRVAGGPRSFGRLQGPVPLSWHRVRKAQWYWCFELPYYGCDLRRSSCFTPPKPVGTLRVTAWDDLCARLPPASEIGSCFTVCNVVV